MSKTYEALKRAEAARTKAKVPDEGGFDHGHHVAPLQGADEYFEVRRSLRAAAVEAPLRTLMMVSALHGEGTSTVACQFAKAMSNGGRSAVLLADLNMRTPSLRRLTKAKEQAGFINVVTESMEIEKAVQPTDTEGVSVLTAGNGATEAIDVLDTSHPNEVIGRLTELAETVIVDTPPVTLYPDARALAPSFDGVILVLEADVTPVSVASRASQILRDAGANVIGVVLNKKRTHIPEAVSRLIG